MSKTPKTTNNAPQSQYDAVADQTVKAYDGKAAPELLARAKEKVLLKEGGSEADAQKEAEKFKQTLIIREALDKANIDVWFSERLARDGADYWENFDQFKIDAPKVHLKHRVILLHHEETAGFPPTRRQVRDQVCVQRKGYQRSGNLGGDPVRDSSLIAAVTSKQQNAANAFIDAYRKELTKTIAAWATRNGLAKEGDKETWETWYIGFCGEACLQNNWFELYRGDAGLIRFLYWRLLYYLRENFANEQGNDVFDGQAVDIPAAEAVENLDGNVDVRLIEALVGALTEAEPQQRRAFVLCLMQWRGETRRDVGIKMGIAPERAQDEVNRLYQSVLTSFRRVFFAKYRKGDIVPTALGDMLKTRMQSPEFRLKVATLIDKIEPETGEFRV